MNLFMINATHETNHGWVDKATQERIYSLLQGKLIGRSRGCRSWEVHFYGSWRNRRERGIQLELPQQRTWVRRGFGSFPSYWPCVEAQEIFMLHLELHLSTHLVECKNCMWVVRAARSIPGCVPRVLYSLKEDDIVQICVLHQTMYQW